LCTDQVATQRFNEDPPIFDEYEEDSDKQIFASTHIESPINGPMYENYASDSFEYIEGDEEIVQFYAYFIVHDVPAFEVDERNLFPSHSDDYCAYAKSDKEYSAQEICQHIPDKFVSFDCYETYDVHELFQGGQEDFGLTNKAEFTNHPFGPLYQWEIFQILQDPMAIYIESECS
jgi:hypothetical protein